ncbi:retrovirus-related Pol polyprotein from type-1 retrotransposable element R2 [Clonorchis sinensis]|uniref:Retrovirus-related Pol polyprotein from type-1 retrotransposable element R2 n=1 Tax=Clonorchis sinensis TaxID=79923 RepID=G7YX43_CLOSI|nr:retrovirus-related Pol polyprotein from type-1 retrotransposable element R2 [Clonorchis sinensis]
MIGSGECSMLIGPKDPTGSKKVSVQRPLLCSVYIHSEGIGIGTPGFQVARKKETWGCENLRKVINTLSANSNHIFHCTVCLDNGERCQNRLDAKVVPKVLSTMLNRCHRIVLKLKRWDFSMLTKLKFLARTPKCSQRVDTCAGKCTCYFHQPGNLERLSSLRYATGGRQVNAYYTVITGTIHQETAFCKINSSRFQLLSLHDLIVYRLPRSICACRLDASLGELRVQQLQTGLTTLFGFNVLVTFDNVHYKTSGASAPVPTSTQERFVGLKCEECGKWCKSKAGLVAHHRVHDSDSVGTNMVAQLACADCSRLFPTKIGLSQHRRHAHPTQHNADKLSRVKHSGARWSQQESQSLLRLANNLYPSCETQTALFARLEQYFPGRSVISIKTRTFPHTWKTVSRRRHQLAHRMPVNRKQIRRANYAAIQTLYHQRRKDAASAVLDGSWKDLYKGNCGLPPDTEQYWKQVLSAPKHVDSRPSRVIVPSDWSLIEPITGEEVGRTVRSMGNSSPGLDKLTPRMLRRFNANVLAGYFNLFLLAGGCPPHLCRARITLVPKVHNPTSPDQLRPISVSSILVRCFCWLHDFE